MSRGLLERLLRRVAYTAALLAVGIGGTLAGASAAVAGAPRRAFAVCEEDDCFLGVSCIASPGNETGCDVLEEPDSTGARCKTYECGILPEG
jgi:hypothetical protein